MLKVLFSTHASQRVTSCRFENCEFQLTVVLFSLHTSQTKQIQIMEKNLINIYQIKVTLSDFSLRVRGCPYRVIAIDGSDSLYKLAEAILNSFDFDMDHCFGFYDNMKDIYRSWEGYELFADTGDSGRFPGVKGILVGEVYNQPKKKMLFFFDYGDSWRFITQLIDVQESQNKKIKPQVTKSVGRSPEQYPDWDEE